MQRENFVRKECWCEKTVFENREGSFYVPEYAFWYFDGNKLKAVGGKIFCDGGETLELKYFAPDNMPELFCKQHEEFWRDIKNARTSDDRS